MRLTENYFQARQAAMKWLKVRPEKRNYVQGVMILQQSGHKPQVAALLARKGELPWTREKLMYTLREMLQVYYNPDDPRFADEDVDVLNDKAGNTTLPEQAVDIKDIEQKGPSYRKWPSQIQRLMSTYAKEFKERAMLSKERAALPDTNDAASVKRRKEISERMDLLSDHMDKYWQLRKRYDEDGTEPSDEEVKTIAESTAEKKENPKEEDEEDFDAQLAAMDDATLQTKRKSAVTVRKRNENMLLYQSRSPKKEPNPMPDSPKRIKIEKKIEKLTEQISKMDYEIAKRM